MNMNPESTFTPEQSAAAVDAILAQNGIPVTESERERLVRFYPLVRGWMERLRMVEARYADPVLVYPAESRD